MIDLERGMGPPGPGGAGWSASSEMPRLAFRVVGADFDRYAAAPTLRFGVEVECAGPGEVHSVQLQAQLRIAAAERSYDPESALRLSDLFGEPERWATTLRALYWTQASIHLAAQAGASLRCELPVPCTYDFEVATAKYFHALADGEVPVDFLFSGTLFYRGRTGGVQIGRFSSDEEVRFRFPVRLWKEMMARHFPGSAWLRLPLDTFTRLDRYRAVRTLPTWDAALELLLNQAEAQDPG